MIIAFSGHRPNKLPNKQTGYIIPNPTYNYVKSETKRLLTELKPDKCISGMALGFDQYAAECCIELNIPFLAYVPFLGQERMWPETSKQRFNELLSKASEIVIVSSGGYSAYKMQVRNQKMADDGDEFIVCWDQSAGGTGNFVKYAKLLNKTMHFIDPRKCK